MIRSLVLGIALFSVLFIVGEADAENETDNPEYTIHFNMKEDETTLSLQTKGPGEPEAKKDVDADLDYVLPGGGAAGRNPVHVGEWISDKAMYRQIMRIESANLWYDESGEYEDNDCIWTFEIKINGETVETIERDCQQEHTPGQDGYTREEVFSISVDITLEPGDEFSMDLTVETWDDIDLFFDNATYDTGYYVVTNPLTFAGVSRSGETVSMEFIEAWPVSWKDNLRFDYIIVQDEYMEVMDNNAAQVSTGEGIDMGNGTVQSTVITWSDIPADNNVKIHMDYTVFVIGEMGGANATESMIEFSTAGGDIIEQESGSGEEGGIPGFGISLVVASVVVVSLFRRRL